jgi:uncharacterized protein (TIGR02246 family)
VVWGRIQDTKGEPEHQAKWRLNHLTLGVKICTFVPLPPAAPGHPNPSFPEEPMKSSMLLLFCLLFLFSCAPPAPNVAEVRKAIDAMNEKGTKDLLAGTMDTTLGHYMDDAISMPNNGPFLKGKKAIKEYYQGMFASGIKFTKVHFATDNVQVSGPYAYEVGTYTMTLMIPVVGEMSDAGKYLTVYEHAPDGAWKIKVETWNTNTAPPSPKAGT